MSEAGEQELQEVMPSFLRPREAIIFRSQTRLRFSGHWLEEQISYLRQLIV